MSAFICTPDHISFLVEAYTQYVVPKLAAPYIDKNRLGQTLQDENYTSVNYRYRENETSPVFCFAYRSEFEDMISSPVTILKQVACYDYQSCETPAYDDSEAGMIMAELRTKIEHIFDFQIDNARLSPEWDQEPWGL